MKKLLPLMKDYKKECVLAPLFKCLEACLDLVVPLIIASLVDKGIHPGSTCYIWQCGLMLLAAAAAGLAMSTVAQYFAAKAAVNFAANLRSAAFSHIQSLSYSNADKVCSNTLITRLTSDINQVQTGVNMALRLLLRSPFIVFGSMIMAFLVDAHAAVVFAVTIPLLTLVVYGIMAITVPLYKKVQSRLDTLVKSTRENLTGVRVIRAFNLQQSETEAFRKENDDYTRQYEHVGRFSALTNPLTYLIVNIATALLLYIGARRVYQGSLSQGQLIALVSYMSQILVELVKLANLIVTITRSIASSNRVEAVLEMPAGMPEGDSPLPLHPDGSVCFDHVSMRYTDSADDVLTDISFRVKKGQTIGIIGGTGSGKSTLVNLIPRFYDVSAGTVSVGGTDVRKVDLSALRQSIGMVPQKAVLFAGTIRENMKYGNPDASDEEIWTALEEAQAAEFVRKKKGGLDEVIEQGGRNLSGGQRQRLTIARALVRHPSILILDDSASALDFATDAALRHAIRNLSDHPTTFLVSQRISTVMSADQILVLSGGTLSGMGTHEALLQTCPVYREIYESQVRKEDESA